MNIAEVDTENCEIGSCGKALSLIEIVRLARFA